MASICEHGNEPSGSGGGGMFHVFHQYINSACVITHYRGIFSVN
jgi:hypothetical protein